MNRKGSTTHISCLDESGLAASVTTTIGEGSGYIIPKTGMMMNNMLGEGDLIPNGFHNWTPDQRISSMMSPTIIKQNGIPQFVLGSGGSSRIRTALGSGYFKFDRLQDGSERSYSSTKNALGK